MKTALVLSGGGAGGAFQIGVLKKIWREEMHQIGAIYGTSVGALNAAALKYVGFETAMLMWQSIQGKHSVLKTNWLSYLGLASGKYKTGPLKSLVRDVLSGNPLHPQIRVEVTAVNLRTGELVFFPDFNPRFEQMVLASASVPFHMEPVGEWVDGGVRDHTPISRAIEAGYKRIIVICTNPWKRQVNEQDYKPKWPYLVDIGIRATDILQNEVLAGDLSVEYPGVQLIRYAPDVRIIDTFDYDPAKIKAAIEQGYQTNASL